MAQLIQKRNSKIDMKFHAKVKNFKRVEKLNYRRNFFKFYVDKNDSVYDILLCEVLSWKNIEKGGKQISVPDEVKETRETSIFDKIKGNPFKIALTKIIGKIEAQELLHS